MRVMPAVCAALMATAAFAVPHETIRHPAGWTKGDKTSASSLSFVVALKHSEAQKAWLKETVEQVSTPGSKRYGKYLSLDELTRQMHVSEQSVEAVRNFMNVAGFRDVELLSSGDFMRASASPSVASAFFQTDFCEWKHEEATSPIIRACEQAYHLPEGMSAHVDFVGGLVHFPKPTGPQRRAFDPAVAAGTIVEDLRTTYNMQGVVPKGKNSTTAFTQFIGQRYNDNDVATFVKKYTPEQEGQTIAKKVGDATEGHGTEALLDAEYLLAMGNGVSTWVWTNQDKNTVNNQEPWVEFFTNVSTVSTVPLLFSISYGEGEDTLTLDYMTRSDTELQKIATRGITVLAASGDNGSGCSKGKFVANFPAALPHITSVGGTSTCTSGSGVASFSSGGFSNFFSRPDWQKDAVSSYMASASLPPTTVYNETGRAYPDISACGNVYICSRGICGIPVAGTSCACPIFAGVMGLLNDARLTAGKAPLGFLAPALYKAFAQDATSFNDVTSGSTQGCLTHSWKAQAGWDPTSGLGTPNYGKLVDVLLTY
eukprot:TRINITY_DN7368_c0_g2_i1.p2 TRINITY_DN7368_c0_g2~~TRINITY_DN7368_c0_g2_i1.p2  ORF type:complete len:541 (+),score=226.35 TRINITY_DN7368_c0_g2_i1:51-1673(+)